MVALAAVSGCFMQHDEDLLDEAEAEAEGDAYAYEGCAPPPYEPEDGCGYDEWTGTTGDIDLAADYLPAFGELPVDSVIRARGNDLCGVYSCGASSDIEPSDSIETCACSAFAACEARHIRSAYGAAVGPCTQDLFVVPQATGCVVERYAGCAALGRYTHEVFQEMRCVADGIELDGLISSAEVSVSPR
jgi:hypothetical protein